jgi:glucosylceramidase
MRIALTLFATTLLFAACSSSDSNSGAGQAASAGISAEAGGVGGSKGGSGGSGLIPSSGGTQGVEPTAGSGATPSTNAGTSGGANPADGGVSGGGASASGGSVNGGSVNGGSNTAGGGAAAGGAGGGTGGSEPFVRPPLVTSSKGAYWVTTGKLTEAASGTADVTVNDASTAQTWKGFGGSFNEKGWGYLSLLSESDRNRALGLLFGRDGCNLTLGRIPIGATDYANDRYSLDEVPAGETDLTLERFSIARDEQQLIPYVKAAQAIKGDLRFWASPWSPPTWMKEGPFNDDSPFDGGSMKGDEATLGALAKYFVKFVQAYADHGISIDVVAPQNEPGYSGTYPTCAWAPETYAAFVGQHLGPALAAANLNTQIMLGTFNGGQGDTDIISTVMGNATSRGYIALLGYQWGMEANARADRQYDIPIWQTEHKCGNYPWEGGFNEQVAPNDHAYAVESWGLLRVWIDAGVNAYSVWNLVLDTVGAGIDSMRFWPQNALMTVDTTAKTLAITPTYYVIRHLAQFVEPGAVVLGTTGGEALAFKNPGGSVVTVLRNSGAAKTYTLAVAGKRLQFEMPADGWATVVQ